MDIYQDLVGKAVAAFRNPSSGENLTRSFEALSVIPLDELLAELSVRMEKITYGQDVPRLIAAAKPPLPENPEALVDIVRRNDLTALRKIFLNGYADGVPSDLIASMVGVVAKLEEVRARAGIMPAYKDLVGKAVAEFLNPSSEENLRRSFDALSAIPLDELLAELSVRIEKITYGQDVPRLIAAAKPPLPENPEALVDIVRRNDLTALHKIFLNGYADGDFAKLVVSIIVLIASLEEAVHAGYGRKATAPPHD